MAPQELINQFEASGQYIGTGNPYSKILFVGKEAGIDKNEENIPGSVNSWKENAKRLYTRYTPTKKEHRSKAHTWQKYQRVFDYVAKQIGLEGHEKKEEAEITFIEYVFTTELSDLHAPKSSQAKRHPLFKERLAIRKKNFWRSEFIDAFDIIVIFSADKQYLEKRKGEVQELFKAEFKEKLSFGKNANQNLWLHYSKDSRTPPRMVIHTRQLVNGCPDELLVKVAGLITEHVRKHGVTVEAVRDEE